MSDARVALRVAAPILTGAALMLSLAMAVASRPVPPVVRSTVLGMVSAVGSLGALFTAPRAALHWRSICHAATVESIIVNYVSLKGGLTSDVCRPLQRLAAYSLRIHWAFIHHAYRHPLASLVWRRHCRC